MYELSDYDYRNFLEVVRNNFNAVINSNQKLFLTNADGLWDAYLDNIILDARQHYNCNACRSFINRFGSLVTISEDGTIKSALWNENDVDDFFKASFKAMRTKVEKSKVTNLFISDDRVLGHPKTGEWHHLSVTLPTIMVNTSRVKTAGQLMAEKREDFRILISSILDYSVETVDTAITLLESEALYRSDRFLGIAKWFKDLLVKRSNATSKKRDNLTWLAVATAPQGFCHVRSSMIGTLLDDIKAGYNFNEISRRFKEKMATYMRSQSAPTEGGIRQAEKLIELYGCANFLRRRYATYEEIPYFLWQGKEVVAKSTQPSGVFSHLKPKDKSTESNNVVLPSAVMTWEKFTRTVLPTADSLEVKADNPSRFMALVTASVEDSENFLLWDNQFTWYYHGGVDGEIKRRVEEAGGRYEDNEIRCSLIWEGYTDLDLHCVTPRREHIYYPLSSRKDRFGGYLDVDANGGGCQTLKPVENIRWAKNAPEGKYRFYVHNYAERGTGKTPFKVELEINGKVYTKHLVAGRTGYQIDIFEFEYIKGQEPIFKNINHEMTVEDAWSVPSSNFTKVTGITTSPNLWGKAPVEHAGNHVFFLLDGCKDSSEGKGRGFFNEMLKPELREIRKVLESYTANTPIEGSSDASACGVGYSKDSEWNLTLKVTSNGSSRIIKIDRWD